MSWIGKKSLALLLLLAVAQAIEPAAAQQSAKPNIVYFLVDNLGIGELSVYSGGPLRGTYTPRIDALAREGLRLLNFAPESQCTPSRSALMTGRYSIRSGNQTVALAGSHGGLVSWERTLGDTSRPPATPPRSSASGTSAIPPAAGRPTTGSTRGTAFRARTTSRCGRATPGTTPGATRSRACSKAARGSRCASWSS
jgi:hypothetical protein